MSNGTIISVGSINVDFQVLAERWPQPGETLLVNRFMMHGGGKGANIAYLARRFGDNAMVIGRVGSGILRETALSPLQGEGVNISHVKTVNGRETGVALIIVKPSAEKYIYLAANANDTWQAGEGDEVASIVSQAQSGSVLTIDLEVPIHIVRPVISAAHARGIRVILDPSPADRMEDDLYKSATFITPNESESQQLTGVEVKTVADARRAGKTLLSRGVGVALVKLGARGCVIVTRSFTEHVPGLDVHAVDTTGAGDSFAGGLAVALLEGQSVKDAVHFAVATSGLKVTRFGSQTGLPTRAEVETVLSELRR